MTEQTPIEVFAEAIELGLKLSFQPPFTLHVHPTKRACPEYFVDVMSYHKPHLLALLQLPFVMARSGTLKETIFFCRDDDTRNCLIEAGAPPCCVYRLAELRTLLECHREAPLSVDELLRIHRARRLFNGTIAE
jgi:hypothetical protein